ncbi:Gp37 family protein [Symbiopectobacterium sp.]|uniref:Gp37 family protein n=1 Tax=Symbiopectobacterium sp. TaxID=2952789 RepID=UPI003F404590
MDTCTLLSAVVERLRLQLPGLHVDFFPERPEQFRLNHSRGAVLVSYGKSRFGQTQDIGGVIQPQTVRLTATVVVKQLNGKGGAVAVLDQVRQCLGGWRPPDCQRDIWLVEEVFLGQTEGLWQYALTVETVTVFIQNDSPEDNPLLTQVNREEQ